MKPLQKHLKERKYKLRLAILFGILIIGTSSMAQQYDEFSKYRVGVKTAINGSFMVGSELQNPRPKFGYTAGAYFRHSIGKDYHVHAELLGNFKGSNFKNGSNEYSRISAFYIDLPIYLAYSFNDNKSNIMIGPQVSYLALSSMFIEGKKKSHADSLNLHRQDVSLCAAYQINYKNAGIQFGLKYGLININNGINFEGINPLTGRGGSIHNVEFEIGFLF